VKRLSPAVAFVIVSLCYQTARAAAPAAPPASPPVEALVSEALSRAPSLAAMRARLAAAREMVAPAGALPDPTVAVVLQDVSFPKWTVGSEQMSMIGPAVEQAIPFPGKRAARREEAGASAEVRASELERLRREIAAQVRTLYARVWSLDRERTDLSAARELLDMLAATAASRYSVGQTDQEAVLKAQLEVSRLAERLDDVGAERAAAVAALNHLLDRPGDTPLEPVAELPPPAVPPRPWEALAVQASPEVAVRQAAVLAAEKRVALARLDFKPDFVTGAGIGLRGGYDPSVTLRFGMVLPIWRREKQRPLLHAAENDLAAARADLRDAQAAARAAAAELGARWQRDERVVELYRQAVVPQSSAAIDDARASYLVGRGDFLTVVDDFNRWLDARVGLARREADRFATWAEVEVLIAPTQAEPTRKEN
jgi:outer membrane protein, heavy metal efflux system